ncbi:MAG: DUF3604 domain-containing protein [bacterium]|nr:DUF3604 domain-containing protein [bacterium]
MPAGPDSVFALDDIRLSEEGVHYFSARSRDGALEAESNPVVVKRDPAVRIYWGETHGHTGFADGQGTEDGYYKFGRDVAFLDFCALSEHDVWQTGYSWQAIAEATKKYHDPGRFVTFNSYEWTAFWRIGGHHNVFFRGDNPRPVGLREGARNISLLYELLRRYNDPADVLIIPHCHDPGTWLTTDAEMQRLVEIYSFHGSFEYYGQKFLSRGDRVGLIAASDNHQAHPGYSAARSYTRGGLAAVLAGELGRDAVFDAMKNRSAYGTSGERILVDFDVNGQAMGGAARVSKARQLRVFVAGTASLDRIDIIKNGKPIFGRDYISGELRGRLRAQVLFRSASNSPGAELDMPRGPRPWNGVLEVTGARLGPVQAIHFDRTFTSQARAAYSGAFSEADLAEDVPIRDEFSADGNAVRFDLETRGDSDGLLLELAGVSPVTEIRVRLRADVEGKSYGGSRHRPRQLPARDLRFAFGALKDGRLAFDVGDDDYRDSVSLQILRDDPVKHTEFTFRDTSQPADGDYYYVRVTQVDGEQAWSSPIWLDR